MKNHPTSRQKLIRFAMSLTFCLTFIYVFLPFLTRTVPILNTMSDYLDANGIDPTRYYYTDVEQVKESELYLENVLDGQ